MNSEGRFCPFTPTENIQRATHVLEKLSIPLFPWPTLLPPPIQLLQMLPGCPASPPSPPPPPPPPPWFCGVERGEEARRAFEALLSSLNFFERVSTWRGGSKSGFLPLYFDGSQFRLPTQHPRRFRLKSQKGGRGRQGKCGNARARLLRPQVSCGEGEEIRTGGHERLLLGYLRFSSFLTA